MFNVKRLAKYLATGVMPERTALDAAIALAEAMDAIDFAAHDRRYHGGKYDPDTMTCGMRQALEKGDLADVLAAEEDEGRERQRFIKDHPDEITDEEFLAYYGKPNQVGQFRLAQYLANKYEPAKREGGGTQVGEIDGMPIFVHSEFDYEFSKSGNSRYLAHNDKNTWKAKVCAARHIEELIKQATSVTIDENVTHKSHQHRKWQKTKGFAKSDVEAVGRQVRIVMTSTDDGRLLLYDIVF